VDLSRGWAVLIGALTIVDFRLLGLAWQDRFGIMMVTWPMMLSAEPERGYGNLRLRSRWADCSWR